MVDGDRFSYCRGHWQVIRRRYRSWHWQLEQVAWELWRMTPMQLRDFELYEHEHELTYAVETGRT
jgi:hypothetical protein